MKTTVETVDETTVKLTVEVEPERIRAAFNEAAQHIAKDIQLPGFRKGKVPRKLLEARIGKDAIKAHAVEDSLGEFYVEAIREHEISPVTQPEIDLDTFDEADGAKFTATVEVVPTFEVPEHEGISVTFPEWDVSDDDVNERLQELRERFAEVDVVERAAKRGDYVTLDLKLEVDGTELEDAAVEDAMYEVGSGGVTPKLDEELEGVVGSSDLTYTDTLPEDYPEHGGKEATFHVTVKDVREKTLPALDDDFAMTASEFDTIDELRKDIRDSLLRRNIMTAQTELRNRIMEAYLALVDVPLPKKMVENDIEHRVGQVEQQAEQIGMEADDLLQMQGMTMEEYRNQVSLQSEQTVKAQLVLDGLAKKLEVEVTEDDLNAEVMRHARARNADPQALARQIVQQGTLGILAGDVARRKAIDTVVAAAQVDGGPDADVLIELGLEDAPADAEASSEEE